MKNNTIWTSKYFCGNEISAYGLKNGYVDYATLAKAFDAVLNNNIISVTGWENWEQENGFVDNSEDIERLNDEWRDIELDLEDPVLNLEDDQRAELEERIEEIKEEIEELEEEENNADEIFQYFIIDDCGAEILKDYTNEIVYYNSDLDMYVWGVTHWGTSWDYVLTDIKIDLSKQATA